MPTNPLLADARLHPELRARVERLLAAIAILGHPIRVTSGYRTVEEQAALYAQGRTTPGAIVTRVDGRRTLSQHQRGRAVDCAFVDGLGAVTWDDRAPWELYGRMAQAVGLVWGGAWKSFQDRPHVELPSTIL
jgi:peptidoglycan LD-endopeptidase CwlK